MPTNRSPRQRRDRSLTLDQRFSLDIGADGVYAGAFPSDADRRAAWFRWREYMLSLCRHGQRPQAWWQYEAPALGITRPADHHFDEAVLYETDLLSPRERKQLHDFWRARYEEAYETEDFTHCLGPNELLHGYAARSAHLRQYGIPPALVDQWEAERKAPPPAA
jgi:hypothetical protein